MVNEGIALHYRDAADEKRWPHWCKLPLSKAPPGRGDFVTVFHANTNVTEVVRIEAVTVALDGHVMWYGVVD